MDTCRSACQPDVQRRCWARASGWLASQVPDDILHNQALNDAIAILPANYNFEVCEQR